MRLLRVSYEASVDANFGVLGETNPMEVRGVTKQPHDSVLSVIPSTSKTTTDERAYYYYYHLILPLLLPHRQLLCRAS